MSLKNNDTIVGKFSSSIKEVEIIGAGISGLLTAYRLKKKGYDITLFDSPESDAKINTLSSPLGLIETGPNAFLLTPELLEILDDLKITYFKIPPKTKKLIYRKSFKSFPLFLFEIPLVLKNLLKKVPLKALSVHDFFVPLLGEKICNEVLDVMIQGIYSAPIQELDFESIFPAPFDGESYLGYLKRLKSKDKMISISFEKGNQEFIDSLRKYLLSHIVQEKKEKINLNVNTIIATNAHDAANLLSQNNLYHFNLDKISYLPLFSTTVFTHTPTDYLQKSFGCLFPEKNSPVKAKGINNNGHLFPNRFHFPAKASYTFISKHDHSLENDMNYLQIIPLEIHKNYWAKALPFYNFERQEIITQLKSHLFKENISFVGNYLSGISLRQINLLARNYDSF